MTHIITLPSSAALVAKLRRQWGDRAFVRYCRNIGIPFETTYEMVFGREPRI